MDRTRNERETKLFLKLMLASQRISHRVFLRVLDKCKNEKTCYKKKKQESIEIMLGQYLNNLNNKQIFEPCLLIYIRYIYT